MDEYLEQSNEQKPRKSRLSIILIIAIVGIALVVTAVIWGFGRQAKQPETAEEWLELGNKYLLDLNYEQAAVAFRKLIAIEPKNVQARLSLADAYVGLDQQTDAEEVLFEVFKIDSSNQVAIDRIIELAAEYQNPEQQSRAESLYSRLQEVDKLNPDIYIARQELYEQLGDDVQLDALLAEMRNIGLEDSILFGSIIGRVLDGAKTTSESPLPETTISVEDSADITRTYTADENGEFRFFVREGTQTFTFSKPGYVSFADTLQIIRNEEHPLLDITLVPDEDQTETDETTEETVIEPIQTDPETVELTSFERLVRKNSQRIAISDYHAAAVKKDGTVVAVGLAEDGQTNVDAWRDIVAVSVGWRHTVGLRANGTVVAVGENRPGQLEVSEWRDIVQISAGGYHTAALKSDGTVVAVGQSSAGQLDVGDWTDIIAISAGGYHTVGLKADGTVVISAVPEAAEPFRQEGWTGIVAIAAGDSHILGLKSDGTVLAFGWNEYGQLEVESWRDIVEIAAGGYNSIGLTSSGTVVAAGFNSTHAFTVSGWTDIVSITAGGNNALGLRSDGTVLADGKDDRGETEVGHWTDIALSEGPGAPFDPIDEPSETGDDTLFPLRQKINTISISDGHTVGVRSDGTVVGSGNNEFGELNVQDWTDITSIVAEYKATFALRSDGKVLFAGEIAHANADVAEWTDIVDIAVSSIDDHVIGLRSDGTVVASGTDIQGKGYLNVDSWKDVIDVAAGDQFTAGLLADGTMVITENDYHGLLDVSDWTGIVSIYAERAHIIGVKVDGTVVSSGLTKHYPLNFSDWTDIRKIATCLSHTVGLKSDGTVVVHGRDGSLDDVLGWTDIVDIAVAYNSVIGLKSDGTVLTAGEDYNGAFQVSDWTDIAIPEVVPDHKPDENDIHQLVRLNAKRIAAGAEHAVAVKTDGTVLAARFDYVDEYSSDWPELDVDSWTNIVAVAASSATTVGLKSDGTVVAVGSSYEADGLNVGHWTDIIAISARGMQTVGLKVDGTVIATEVRDNYEGQMPISGSDFRGWQDWTDIVAIASGEWHTVGLKSDGTVVTTGLGDRFLEYGDWTDIVAIDASSHGTEIIGFTVGLKSDGTVLAVGKINWEYDLGVIDLPDWTDIVAIAVGNEHIVGLKSDGTLLTFGDNTSGQREVSDWTDIVAIEAGSTFTLGLKLDGTVLVAGSGFYDSQLDLSAWSDIIVFE